MQARWLTAHGSKFSKCTLVNFGEITHVKIVSLLKTI